MLQELRCCTLEEVQGLSLTFEEEVQITSAYPMTQSTHSPLELESMDILHDRVVTDILRNWYVWRTISEMSLVPYATLQLGEQRS